MKPLLILLSVCMCTSLLHAQKQPDQIRITAWENFKAEEGNQWTIRWNEETGLPRTIVGATTKAFPGDPLSAARAFLNENRQLFALKSDLSGLRHSKTQTHRGVHHVAFQQYYKGLKVEGAQYKVHIREDGTVDMANGYYYDNIDIPIVPTISSLSAINVAMSDLELTTNVNKNTSELVIYPQGEKFHLAHNIEVLVKEPFTNWQYFVDATNGNILKAYNKITPIYATTDVTTNKLSKEKASKNSTLFVTGTGKVYRKHPGLSSVTTENLLGLDGNGKLDGTYVRAKNSSTSDAYSASHSFQYATTNTHFDEVSLYYHVDNFRRNFIEGLDSGNDLFNFIEAYAHNNSICPNNACYDPSTQDIYFSDGYEFAKEDKVIHHEYSHKVVRDIESGIQSNGGEEGSISEGTPDYLAGSFTGRSKILEYSASFAERDMSSPFYTDYSQLPTNGNGDVIVGSHIGGEFFSSILWDIRNNSGITTGEADFLVFDALFRVSGNPDFLEFRDAMLSADNAAYSGTHYQLINNSFADKGVGTHYYPPIPAPTNFALTNPGGSFPSFTWSASSQATSYKIYRKCNNGYFGDYTASYQQVGSTSGTSWSDYSVLQNLPGQEETYIYGVKAFNSTSQSNYSNLVAVDGQPSSSKVVLRSLPQEFSISNNYPNPFNPTTQIKFELPETAEISIKVYNIMGQEVATLVNKEMQAGFHNQTFDATNLASGVYIARLSAIGSSGEQFLQEIKMQLIK